MEIRDWLIDRFTLPPDNEVDAAVELNWGDGACRFHIDDAGLKVVDDHPCHFSIVFDSESTMRDVLTGSRNPMHAFSAGGLRSTGYIVWTFRVLGMFTRAD